MHGRSFSPAISGGLQGLSPIPISCGIGDNKAALSYMLTPLLDTPVFKSGVSRCVRLSECYMYHKLISLILIT